MIVKFKKLSKEYFKCKGGKLLKIKLNQIMDTKDYQNKEWSKKKKNE